MLNSTFVIVGIVFRESPHKTWTIFISLDCDHSLDKLCVCVFAHSCRMTIIRQYYQYPEKHGSVFALNWHFSVIFLDSLVSLSHSLYLCLCLCVGLCLYLVFLFQISLSPLSSTATIVSHLSIAAVVVYLIRVQV